MTSINDFSDWISPMLVKELRQGVRGRVFIYSLLLLQLGLMLMAIWGLVASDAHQDIREISVFFWALAAVFLILLLPMSGLQAVAVERTSNTLDLIFLTRLTARRIIFGKWLAIVAQIVLLIFTMLPYIVLRYFLGGIDLWQELLTTGALLIVSATLSAIAVGLSPLASALATAARVIGVIIGLWLLAYMLASFFEHSFLRGLTWRDGVFALVFAVFVTVTMLEFGAARIAPPAENHSAPLRLIALGAILAGIALDYLYLGGAGRTVAFFCLTVPVLIGALCESPKLIPTIYTPFVRRGFPGKLAGFFLYPGWPSALPFALLVIGVFTAELASRRLAGDNPLLTGVILLGALLLPAAITHLIGKRARYPLAIFFGVFVLFVLLYSFASILESFKWWTVHAFVDFFPPCALMALFFADSQSQIVALFPAIILVTVLSGLIFFLKSLEPWREMRAMAKQARQSENRGKTLAPAPEAAEPAL